MKKILAFLLALSLAGPAMAGSHNYNKALKAAANRTDQYYKDEISSLTQQYAFPDALDEKINRLENKVDVLEKDLSRENTRLQENTPLIVLGGLGLITAGLIAMSKDNAASGICGAACVFAGAGIIAYRFQ